MNPIVPPRYDSLKVMRRLTSSQLTDLIGNMPLLTMEKIVQRQLNAYNERNIDRFCENYHQEVECVRLLSNTISCQGITAFRKIYEDLFESSPKLHCELKHRIVLQDVVIDEEFITGAANYPQGLHTVVIYSFCNGLINRVWLAKA